MELTDWEYRVLLGNSARRLQELAEGTDSNYELRRQLRRVNEIMDALDPLPVKDPEDERLEKIWVSLRDLGIVSYLRPTGWVPSDAQLELLAQSHERPTSARYFATGGMITPANTLAGQRWFFADEGPATA